MGRPKPINKNMIHDWKMRGKNWIVNPELNVEVNDTKTK